MALSRHRDGDLHYGRDDFASQDKLINTLSRDRAKDMATDYEQIDPAQDYAERRGITFRDRVVEIVRRIIPEKLRDRINDLLDGLRQPESAAPDHKDRQGPERDVAEARREAAAVKREAVEKREAALRQMRTRALVYHARAVDAIFDAQAMGQDVSPEQRQELTATRRAFEDIRPYGSHDAEAAYLKNPGLAREAAAGQPARAFDALLLETERRIDLQLNADRFVDRWQELSAGSQRQYQDGDISGYKASRSAMADMAQSLERDPQMESLLASRKADLGIAIETGHRLGIELAFNHGIGLGRGRDIGL